jgi:hypothetical protein
MNSMKSSSKVLLSFYQYSYTYELEYSFHVMILTYELAYSSYVMSLTCRTLFLIFHAMYMHKNRVMLRWWFIMPLGVPRSFTCRSIGSESWWDLGSFCVIGRGARVHRDRWMHFLLHGWGVGNRWCQPCPSLVIPHVWVGCRILNCHIKLLTDQYLVASRLISCLALALVHVHVWSSPILCMAILEQACST